VNRESNGWVWWVLVPARGSVLCDSTPSCALALMRRDAAEPAAGRGRRSGGVSPAARGQLCCCDATSPCFTRSAARSLIDTIHYCTITTIVRAWSMPGVAVAFFDHDVAARLQLHPSVCEWLVEMLLRGASQVHTMKGVKQGYRWTAVPRRWRRVDCRSVN
jgi:hypothetical protein